MQYCMKMEDEKRGAGWEGEAKKVYPRNTQN
jgi:hypothetical protein